MSDLSERWYRIAAVIYGITTMHAYENFNGFACNNRWLYVLLPVFNSSHAIYDWKIQSAVVDFIEAQRYIPELVFER